MQTAVCLICVKPDDIWIEFLSKFTHYKVFIVIDSPEIFKSPHESVTYIQIPDEECGAHGFSDMNFLMKKPITGWEKALYYFSLKNKEHGYVWFLEEDVFVPRADIFKKLDKRYPTTDLVTKQHVKDSEDPSFEFWYDGDGKMERPFYRSLVCSTRVSRRLFDKVKELHDSKNTLCFIEIIFNTLAVQNGFTIEMPSELQTIIFRHTWTEGTVNSDGLFHPVKDTALHDTYRERLASQTESEKVD